MHSQSVASWVEELARNNEKPSEEEVKEVKDLLIIPLEKLQIIDSEILDLKTRLSELQSKREETQKQISRLTSILAPIRRVPTDVLGEIFYQCLPTHRNPIMKSTDCPLLLTRICSPWRATAMSSPRLWERLYITFTDDDSVPDLETAALMVQNGEITSAGWQTASLKSEKECRAEVLRRRLEAVREWFLRSGSRPLSLSMSFTNRFWYTVPYSERPSNITTELLSLLATFAPRFKDLELDAAKPIYDALEQAVTVSEMKALTSLRIRYPPQFMEPLSATSHLVSLVQAPGLRQLSIFANDGRILGIRGISCRWDQLTSLSCFDPLTINETVFLLENSCNLAHYKGTVSEYIIDEDDQDFVYEGHISLPFLQTLSLSEYVNPHRVGNIYDRIDAPSLESFRYFSNFYPPPGEFSAANPAPIPILPLLRKSVFLRKLYINATNLTIWDLGPMLRAVPTITHFVIGFNDRDRDTSTGFPSPSLTPLYYDPSGGSNGQLWTFDKLVVSEHDGDELPFLPRLTSLSISSMTARINDDIIFNIVKSRMMPSGTANPPVAALEYVKIKFHRKKSSRDIVLELNNHAESLGVKIALDIAYSPPTPPENNTVSPEFGLVGPGGTWTWPYIDAGEDE